MKNSKKLFIGLVILLLAAPVWYAAVLKQRIGKVEPRLKQVIPKAKTQTDYPIAVESFRYLVSDGVSVSLDTGECAVTLRTYEDLRQYVSVEVRDDTLFLSRKATSFIVGQQWVSAKVQAPALKGLSVVNGGEIEGKTEIVADHLVLEAGEGVVLLSLDVESVQLRYRGPGKVALLGKAGRLMVEGGTADGSLSALSMEVDTAYILSSGRGAYQVHVKDYLNADLRNNYGDLVYRGNPVVEKKENARGRVIRASPISR